MGNDLLVSVIIPVFNVASYIVEALDSVAHQTYGNLEIIIVDDGSTDGSGKICDDYARKDKRFYVVHQANEGLSAARNTGLDLMNGEAVAFLDPDDAYHPDFIRAMVKALINENADLVVCKYTKHNTSGIMKQARKSRPLPLIEAGVYDRKSILRSLVKRQLNHAAWNKLYCKKLWNNFRYPVGVISEDTDTTYKILNYCNNVCVINLPLYFHRIRPGSISFDYSKKALMIEFVLSLISILLLKRIHPDYFLKSNREKAVKHYLIK